MIMTKTWKRNITIVIISIFTLIFTMIKIYNVNYIIISKSEKNYIANNNCNQAPYWQTIKGDKYYFDCKGQMQKGITVINGQRYFLGEISGKLKYNFVTALNGDIYYTGTDGIVRTGWQTIDGYKYYFGSTGIMQKGIKTIDGQRYFFGEISGKLKYDFVTALNKDVYYTGTDGIVRTGWQTIKGYKYYFDEQGIMTKGIREINGKGYFFGENSGQLKYNFVTALNGDVYYTGNNGIVRYGITLINGKRYFFGELSGKLKYNFVTALNGDVYYTGNDGIVRTGWQTISGYKYYFDTDGIMQKGIITIDGKRYFFGELSGKLKYDFVTKLNGDIYYTGNNGIVRTGWQTIKGYKYYFNTNGIMQKGIKTISGKNYFFGENSGQLKYNFVTALNGNVYYTGNDGIIRTGWQPINRYLYYFGTSGIMTKGIKEINGQRYFFGENSGQLKHNFVVALNNDTYYTGNDGIIRTGWQTIDGYKYYFNTDGVMQKGIKTIDGQRYFFGENSGQLKYNFVVALNKNTYYTGNDGILKTGWQTIDGYKYYFDMDGIMQKGIKTIDFQRYFFGENSGQLKYNFVTALNGNVYYTGNDGIIRTGEVSINGFVYKFNSSGILQPSWQTKNGNKYYIKKDGKLATGWNVIDGNRYYFKSNGIMVTGSQTIEGSSCVFDTDGILLKIQYVPKYYSQKDNKWKNNFYGKWNLSSTGCLPTSMAMALSGILNKQILPTDVAKYLYNNTNEFNRITAGASGAAIKYSADYYKVKWQGINSLSQLNQALSDGKIIVANMGPGLFAGKNYTHAIVLHKYVSGKAYVFDPNNSNNNFWVSTTTVWNQRSNDSYDLRGGYAFYALSRW